VHIALITPGFRADQQDWCIPVVRDLVAGLAAALAEALAEVVDDRSLRDRMGAAALDRVRLGLSMEGCVAALDSPYSGLTGRREGRQSGGLRRTL
jgi:glycosyltransferase involved in cell wall biosynthesis